jgi:membrane-associated phospholipid phosphatase
VIVYVFAFGTSAGRHADRTIKDDITAAGGSGEVEAFDDVLDWLWAPVAVVGLYALWRLARDRNRAAARALCVLLAAPIAYLLKVGLHALDPLAGDAWRLVETPSFPSGHTTAAAAAALASILLAPPAWRDRVLPMLALLPGMVGVASVGEGGHFPSDVAAGYLVAVVVAALVGGTGRLLRGDSTWARWPQVVAAAALVVAFFCAAAGEGPISLVEDGNGAGLAGVAALALLGAAVPALGMHATVSQRSRSTERAAKTPHMPWTPPPGGVDDEQR